MSSKINIFLLILLFWCGVEGYKDYKDYKIYNVIARTAEQQQFLHELSQEKSYDFLALSRSVNKPTRVLVPPHKVNSFVSALTQSEIYYVLLVDDISSALAKQHEESALKYTINRLNAIERYYRHEEINNYLETLAKIYPTRVFVKTFGRTYEGRFLKTVTITNGDGRIGKKIIFVDAAVHAREWITPAMALHIINELIENYSEHAELLQEFDWVILPVVNADGYEYTHEVDRYWRKTRKPNDLNVDCVGTDINRNFDFQWGLEDGSSSEPCDETYRGSHPFSEPEAVVLRDLMWHYKDSVKYYLSLHSYGNYILLPWGYTSSVPDNFFGMMDVADEGAMAIVRATGSSYSYGNAHSVIYATSGDSTDYAVGAVNISVAMTMELPAGGFTGFDPPVRQIEDIVTETWIGVKAMAEAVVKKY